MKMGFSITWVILVYVSVLTISYLDMNKNLHETITIQLELPEAYEPNRVLNIPFVNENDNSPLSTGGDIECMTKNLFFEAGVESLDGKLAVMSVTMNRVKSSKFPNTLNGVLYKKRNQFSWVLLGKKVTNKIKRSNAWKTSERLAEAALSEGVYNFKDTVNGSLYYHADYSKPIWRHKLEYVAKVDTHLFYRDK